MRFSRVKWARKNTRYIRIILFTVAAGISGMVSVAHAQSGTLDQSFESNCSLTQAIWKNLDIGQTFTAGLSGSLTAFDVQLIVSGSSATDLFWEIQETEPASTPGDGPVPNGQIAASGILSFAALSDGWQTIPLLVPIQILSGEQLAIVLTTSIGDPAAAPLWCGVSGSGATYSAGDALRFGGVFWNPHNPPVDHDFHSYVPEPSRPLQFTVALTALFLLQLLRSRRRATRFREQTTNNQSC